jgi:Activator of Hsp90 ATPase homolog 1-like protein
MTTSDFTIPLLLDKTPAEVFNAIQNVRGWWSEEIEGYTEKLHDEFTYHFEDLHYCQLKLTEVIPNEKVVWLVKYNYFKHTKDKSEWTGTKVIFEIARKENQTQLHFTHLGLTPEFECFDVCSNGWNQYIRQSLVSLIKTGEGLPNATGKPRTDDEVRLRNT